MLVSDLKLSLTLGADASITSDNTALVGVSRHPDPELHDHVVVRFARRWVRTLDPLLGKHLQSVRRPRTGGLGGLPERKLQ